MMNRRLFLRLLLALSAAVGMSGSVLLLLERLGLLDSTQRPQIEAQRAEFEKAARKQTPSRARSSPAMGSLLQALRSPESPHW